MAIWDQTDSTGPSPKKSLPSFDTISSLDFGTFYDSSAIVNGQCRQKDKLGHGTAVASIAVGDTYGLASFADLIVVKVADGEKFNKVDLVHGINFIAGAAIREYKQPFILCLCLTPYSSIKDGKSDELEARLRSLLDEDRYKYLLKGIVVAAGNKNYDSSNYFRNEANRNHCRKFGTDSFTVEVETTPKPDDDYFKIEIFHPANSRYEALVVSPSGETLGPAKFNSEYGWNENHGVRIANNEFPEGVNLEKPEWGNIVFEFSDPIDEIVLKEGWKPLESGNWKVILNLISSDSTSWDAYIEAACPHFNSSGDTIYKTISQSDCDNSFKIQAGGHVNGVITVGSANNGKIPPVKTSEDSELFIESYPKNKISHFSSRLGSKSGSYKPEIYAYGAFVKIAASADIPLKQRAEDEWLYLPDHQHKWVMGTSFSAPLVAATIALMVQADENGSLDIPRINYIIEEQSADWIGLGINSFRMLNTKKAVEISRRY